MKQISAMDLHYLIRDFQVLINGRVQNFYKDGSLFYMQLYVRGKGHLYLVNDISQSIFMSSEKKESKILDHFVKYLRKHLRNGFVREIIQIPAERILKVVIETKTDQGELKKFTLLYELFANGNVLLLEGDIIKSTIIHRKFKDREILVNREYKLPPKNDFVICEIDENKLFAALKESEMPISVFLAVKFGLGGKYSGEICKRCNIENGILTTEINNQDVKKILSVIGEIFNFENSANCLIDDNGKLKDFYPFEFKSVSGEFKKFGSFNDAIQTYFNQGVIEEDKREKEFEKELNKLRVRLKKQEVQLDQVQKDYEKFNGFGNIVYNNYSQIDELLNSINKAAKEKGWEHVVEVVKGNPELSKVVKKLDYKNNKIVLDIE